MKSVFNFFPLNIFGGEYFDTKAWFPLVKEDCKGIMHGNTVAKNFYDQVLDRARTTPNAETVSMPSPDQDRMHNHIETSLKNWKYA